MALEYVIQYVEETGLRVKSAWVILKNDTPIVAYRRAEAIMLIQVDVDAFVGGLLDSLWSYGDDSDEAAFLAPGEKPFIEPIYVPIIQQIFPALAGPASIDVILGKIETLLQESPAKYVKFYAAMEKLGIEATTPEGKREQLLWAVVLALVGLANSDIT